MPKKTKKDLKELLQTVKVIKSAETMFDKPIIEPYMFCPKCGCREMESFGNKVFYPEHYEKFYCMVMKLTKLKNTFN